MGALRKILVPLYGSPSVAALEHALVLAKDCDATIDALQVVAPDDFEIGSSTALTPEARQEALHEVDVAIEQAEARLGERIERRTSSGDPMRRIVETASEGGYDLIVMGTHGRVGRLHAMLGSVAEGVIRNAPCPVLTVREPGGSYQSFAERRHGEPTVAEQMRPSRTHS